MKNLKERIAILETKHSDPLIDAIYDLTSKFAHEQVRPKSEMPGDALKALNQLAKYLPN